MAEPIDYAPAPWQLSGRGHLVLLRCTRAFGNTCARGQPSLQGRAVGGVGAVMIVEYASSQVGAYRELLIAPGSFKLGGKRVFAITHIWVSTQASVINGRRNWGLPKQKAAFQVQEQPDGTLMFTVNRPERPPVEMTFTGRGPALPITTGLLPRRWRTLDQPWDNRVYRTRVRAAGRSRYAKLAHYRNPAETGFPDFGSQKRPLCLQAPNFELSFPLAEVTENETGA